MLINPNQIRAARGLLDWTVADLGKKVGVGATTISAIETGRSSGSLEVLSAIIYAFQSAGVEISDDGGVRPRQGKIMIFRGHKGFRAFFDDIYETAKNFPMPDLVHTNVREEDYSEWLGSYSPVHLERMAKLGGYRVRALLHTGDRTVTASEYAEYRWIPAEQFADVSFYFYGEKSAFIEFTSDDVQVTVVDNPSVTKALRKSFEVMWAGAFKNPDGKK